jgi:hypothetical protein
MPDAEDTCRPVEVDGEIIRVHGSREMTEEEKGYFAEIVRAAKARMETEPERPSHTVTIGERSTTHLRTLCRPQVCGWEPQRGGHDA